VGYQPTQRLSDTSRILTFLVRPGGTRDTLNGNACWRNLRRSADRVRERPCAARVGAHRCAHGEKCGGDHQEGLNVSGVHAYSFSSYPVVLKLRRMRSVAWTLLTGAG